MIKLAIKNLRTYSIVSEIIPIQTDDNIHYQYSRGSWHYIRTAHIRCTLRMMIIGTNGQPNGRASIITRWPTVIITSQYIPTYGNKQ